MEHVTNTREIGPRSAAAARPAVVTGAVWLAHSDGFSWDEALIVLAPVALAALALLLATRRAGRREARDPDQAGEAAEPRAESRDPTGRDPTGRDPTGG